ncbi:MAG: hypothetical protein ABEJ58_10825 [Halodesulfurarchaeum sp.]
MSNKDRGTVTRDGLETAMVVVGSGRAGTDAVDRLEVETVGSGEPGLETAVARLPGPTAADSDEFEAIHRTVRQTADAVIIATDLGEGDVSPPILADPPPVNQITVLVTPLRSSHPTKDALEDTLDAGVDTVVLVPTVLGVPAIESLRRTLSTLITLVDEPGFVNVDLADAKTVFDRGDIAVMGTGTAANGATDEAERAVFNALESIPASIPIDSASNALLDVRGGEGMTMVDTNGAVEAVRTRIGDESHIIWGAGIDAETDRLTVRLLLSGVEWTGPVAGDVGPLGSCPRCGEDLVSYSFGHRRTVSCDSCGYADVSMQME